MGSADAGELVAGSVVGVAASAATFSPDRGSCANDAALSSPRAAVNPMRARAPTNLVISALIMHFTSMV